MCDDRIARPSFPPFPLPYAGRSLTLLDPTYASRFVPIIASVSEHQPPSWPSYITDLHFAALLAPAGIIASFRKLDNGKLCLGRGGGGGGTGSGATFDAPPFITPPPLYHEGDCITTYWHGTRTALAVRSMLTWQRPRKRKPTRIALSSARRSLFFCKGPYRSGCTVRRQLRCN